MKRKIIYITLTVICGIIGYSIYKNIRNGGTPGGEMFIVLFPLIIWLFWRNISAIIVEVKEQIHNNIDIDKER